MTEKICVVGLGYVGLPLACHLSKHFAVIGFDINDKKITELQNGIDQTGEVENLKQYQVDFSADPQVIKDCSFIIVAVPTPINEDKLPDLQPLQSASEIVGKNLSAGVMVVFESTVYPGCTEEVCLPIIEEYSGLKVDKDFDLGYSPERINPGDKVRTIDKITKVVSGSSIKALKRAVEVYGKITDLHQAPSIKVAEAAKVIENVQRSLNIALMNELALIFDKIGISTKDVLAAAGTKWNFHKYTPGLVGGHCIGVDPYYLTYKAKELGYNPEIILSGQGVNEAMAGFVASKFNSGSKVLIMGATFKENVADTRNSKAQDLAEILQKNNCQVIIHDPLLAEYKNFPSQEKFDGIIVFSPHDEFKEEKYSLGNLKKIANNQATIFDVKNLYSKNQAQDLGFNYLTF